MSKDGYVQGVGMSRQCVFLGGGVVCSGVSMLRDVQGMCTHPPEMDQRGGYIRGWIYPGEWMSRMWLCLGRGYIWGVGLSPGGYVALRLCQGWVCPEGWLCPGKVTHLTRH